MSEDPLEKSRISTGIVGNEIWRITVLVRFVQTSLSSVFSPMEVRPLYP